MTGLKRPERGVQFESIKPELKKITEFYTRKVTDYQHCLKQLSEYADALENEISVLKETHKVEVPLDNTDKHLVVVPKFVADWFEIGMLGTFNGVIASYSFSSEEAVWWVRDNGGIDLLCKMKLYGYTVKKERLFILKHIDMSNNDDAKDWYLAKDNFGKFYDAWGYKNMDSSGTIPDLEFTQSEIDKLHTGSYEQIEVVE